jgi:hypothetical protein
MESHTEYCEDDMKLINELFALSDDETTDDTIYEIVSQLVDINSDKFSNTMINIDTVDKMFAGCKILHFYEDILDKEKTYKYDDLEPTQPDILVIILFEVKNHVCIVSGININENEMGNKVIEGANFFRKSIYL